MTEVQDMLPKELEETLRSVDFMEVGGLLINSISAKGDDLRVDFILSFDGYDIPKQYWRIDIKGIEAEKIVRDLVSYPEFFTDHYLLYDFTENYIELYFNGKADNAEKLFIDLYQLHSALFDNKISVGKYLNAPDGIIELCNRGHGLFARGPKKILEHYEKCLAKHGVKTNFINEKEKEKKDLKLLIFGDSYFVGQSFEFTKLQN